jgi:membrane fusion protein, multidrug efflux system
MARRRRRERGSQGQLAKDTALHAQAQSDLARFQTLGKQDSIALQQVADQQFLVAQDAAAMETDKGVIASDAAGLHDAGYGQTAA